MISKSLIKWLLSVPGYWFHLFQIWRPFSNMADPCKIKKNHEKSWKKHKTCSFVFVANILKISEIDFLPIKHCIIIFQIFLKMMVMVDIFKNGWWIWNKYILLSNTNYTTFEHLHTAYHIKKLVSWFYSIHFKLSQLWYPVT